MSRQIITADDVAAAQKTGAATLRVASNALITPLARDKARETGLVLELGEGEARARPVAAGPEKTLYTASDEGTLRDIREEDLFAVIPVKNPHDAAALARLRAAGPARICLDRAGPRYKTRSLLRFKADHAAAVDAAFTDVSDEFLAAMKLPVFQSLCNSREEYLQRPDLGRMLSPDQLNGIKKVTGAAPRVVVYFADGLSSTALETNGPDTYQALAAGLKRHDIQVAAPFFVRWARVPSQDCICEATGAEVVCTLIGERPGLVSAESLSAYFSYKAYVDMPEARRTVISNIHRGGTPAVEAGAYIADIIKLMLEKKAGGTDLPL